MIAGGAVRYWKEQKDRIWDSVGQCTPPRSHTTIPPLTLAAFAGCLIVRVQPPHLPVIVWAPAIVLATTTNNIAEFAAAVAGLRRLTLMKSSRFTVIGDSAMILRLLHLHHPPRARHQLGYYYLGRRLADRLPIAERRHHFRTTNRMADIMANLAMDIAASKVVVSMGTTMSLPAGSSAIAGTAIQNMLATDTHLSMLCATDRAQLLRTGLPLASVGNSLDGTLKDYLIRFLVALDPCKLN